MPRSIIQLNRNDIVACIEPVTVDPESLSFEYLKGPDGTRSVVGKVGTLLTTADITSAIAAEYKCQPSDIRLYNSSKGLRAVVDTEGVFSNDDDSSDTNNDE